MRPFLEFVDADPMGAAFCLCVLAALMLVTAAPWRVR